ncbi:hypothetical protein M9978_10835 [Sphingomonas sp. MG17]|uniref:Uncharacterized protein n=1 Tax=Sphingomonas tagetis TaxID=2949092 RepID=A0A9X2HQU4_9SPHN|nr:hypothetical protein [Sphingomonas tagetis]MCP3730925.1 hypothetical protein [Sphingomonas tagetis]
MKLIALTLAASFAAIVPASAQTSPAAPAAAAEAWPEAWFEIFKLAPGKQEDFIRRLDQTDQVRAAAGLPPVQIFFHENGAEFDVILFKPVAAAPTPEQEAKMAAKRKELGIPSGPAYFVDIREFIASHTDSRTIGPVSAGQWIRRLDGWRAANPPRAKFK